MKSLHHFIVELPEKFKSEISFNGGKLHLINKFQEFEHRVNNGRIVATPKGISDYYVGCTLYFHHHVVMEQKYDIGENLYLVSYDRAGGYSNHSIAIEDKNDNLNMLGDWCFVLPPADSEEETSSSGIILSIKEEPELEGVLVSLPSNSDWIGAKVGDTVGYTKDSDYSMVLKDDTKIYRMRTTELVYVKEA